MKQQSKEMKGEFILSSELFFQTIHRYRSCLAQSIYWLHSKYVQFFFIVLKEPAVSLGLRTKY